MNKSPIVSWIFLVSFSKAPSLFKFNEMERKFVICINNKGNEASLERGKVYQVVNDNRAAQHNLFRIIDESGEGTLFPTNYFVAIDLPKIAREALAA